MPNMTKKRCKRKGCAGKIQKLCINPNKWTECEWYKDEDHVPAFPCETCGLLHGPNGKVLHVYTGPKGKPFGVFDLQLSRAVLSERKPYRIKVET